MEDKQKSAIYGLRTTANREDQVMDFVVSNAKRKYKTYQEERKLKEKVITHLLKYKTLPGDFHDLGYDEQKEYKRYISWNEFDLHKELGKPIGNRFYITKEVNPLEREKLSEIGFRNYAMPNPSQKNGFIQCFIFNDTATTEIYTLSLHDALPIS